MGEGEALPQADMDGRRGGGDRHRHAATWSSCVLLSPMAAVLCLTAVQCHMQFPLVTDPTTAQQQSAKAQSVGFGDKLPVTKYLLCDLRVLSYNMGQQLQLSKGFLEA